MKVLAYPRGRNPYQADLYGAMTATDDVTVRYLAGPTRSQTVNLLLLPLGLLFWRVAGFRLLHLHWVYEFRPVWCGDRRWVPKLAARWFALVLGVTRGLGYRLVWTAHNVVPHEPVFADDEDARRRLVAACDAVIAHSAHTARELARFGAATVDVIPPGVAREVGARRPATLGHEARAAARARLGLHPESLVVVFFGQVLPYKGVDLLLDAAAELDPGVALDVVVAGACRDDALARDLESRAARAGGRARLDLSFLADAELERRLAAADFAVFPFRSVTSSSSVLHALATGLPVIIPALPELADVPDAAGLRYDPRAERLVDVLTAAAALGSDERGAMADAARSFASSRAWSTSAAATCTLYRRVLGATPARERPRDRDGVAAELVLR